MTGTDVTPKERIDALTGLRFFAAMIVFLSHLPKPDFLPTWLATFFDAGYNGVTIFFVLSGFVIGLNYFESLSQPSLRALLKYFSARWARVYPLYFLVLLYVWLDRGAPQAKGILEHFLAIQTWSPNINSAYGYNSPGWSVGVEFFLYACFPLIVIPLARWRENPKFLWTLAAAVTLVLIALAIYFRLSGGEALPLQDPNSAHRWLYRTPITRLGDFILGIVGALLFKHQKKTLGDSDNFWIILTYGTMVSMVLLMLWRANLDSVFSWDVSYAPLAFLFMLGLARVPQTRLARFLATPALVVLGEASYALYLIHSSLIDKFGIERFVDFDPWVTILLWIMFVALAIILSIGLNVYVEAPIRRMINKWASKLDPIPTKPASELS